MDNYEYTDPPAKKKTPRLEMWDMLSILMLLITLCMGVYFVAIFVNPNSRLNPLPPNPVDPNAPPTATITPIHLEPTWTPTPINATATATLLPTFTPIPSPTLLSMITPTVTPTFTPTPKAPFSANITYIDSTIIHPELGCNWQGIGGTVVDANAADILYMQIRLIGTYNGKPKNEVRVSGMVPMTYGGKAGFEFVLGTTPVSSHNELYLQLLDQAGLPLADNVYIDTFNDCTKNLILVRFKKNR